MKNHSFPALVLTVLFLAGVSLVYVITSSISLPNPSSQTAQVSGSLGQGLVAYWNLNEGSGSTANDTSGSGNNGSLSNAGWTTGKIGGAASFNGSNSSASDSSVNLSGTNAISISMWLNPSNLNTIVEGTSNFNSATTGFGIFYNDSPTCPAGSIGVELKGNTGYNVRCFSSAGSGWHHYVFVLDKSQGGTGEIKMYADGSQANPSASPHSNDNTNNFGNDPIYLMSRAGSTSFSSGSVDDFRIYNRALTSSDVSALFSFTGGGDTGGGGTNKFKIGDRIRVTANDAFIYSNATISSTKLGQQLPGVLGTVIGGPSTSESHTWYRFDFDNSTIDGWDWQDDVVLDNNPPPPPPPPPATITVSSLTASNITSSGASVSWTTNIAADTQVQYGLTNAYGSNTALNSTLGTSHSATISGLQSNTVYHYRARSANSSTNIGFSADATFTTAAGADTQAPTVPNGLTATAVSSSQINLAWNASTDNVAVTGYRVFRNGTQIANVTSGTTFQNISGLTPDTSYSYTVSAYDAATNASAQSAAATARTQPGASSKFIVGDRVRVANGVLNVRVSPSTSAQLSGALPIGTIGTISNPPSGTSVNPTYADGYWWWYFNSDSAQDGWGIENNMEKYVVSNTFRITIIKAGTGTGSVTGGSISCGATCTAEFTVGTNVSLNAQAAQNSSFTGWTGASGCTTAPTCTVSTDSTITATFTTTTTGDTQAPTIPTGLTATAVSSSQINLSWSPSTDNIGVTGYKVYRGGNQIGTAVGTSYQDTGLSAGTGYSYTVSAYDAAGNNSAQSSAANATTQPGGAQGNPIDAARRTTWNSGVPGGIPNRAVCTTLSPGSTVAQINSALQSSACDGKAVMLNEGTYNLSGTITVPTNRTLRGAGANKTKLVKTNGTFFMIGANSSDGGSASVTSGYNKDSRQLTLSSASGITTNHYLIISQNNPSYVTPTGDNGTCSWCGENSPGRTMTQIVKVTGVSGNTVSINQPLYTSFSNSPQVKIISMVTTMAGVEDLSMAQTQLYDNKGGGENIHVEYCAYCWVKGVYSYKSNGNDHIWVRTSYGDEFRDNFFNDAWQQVSDRGYGIWFFNRNSDQLVINNIFKTLRHSVSFEGGGSGVVIAYNYMLDPYEQDNPDGLAQEMNYHGSHPFMNLWEGNYATNIAPDNIFGSNSDSTYFRNYVSGQRPQRPTNYGQWIMNIQANSTRHNFVGNVMGFAGMASAGWTYESVSTCSGQIKTIWLFGCASFSGTNSGRTTAPKTTAFLSDNFDYVTNSVDSQLSYTLEPSMFLSGRPSWWGTAAWPPIGPDVAGKQTTIPAKTCYDGVASNPSNYNAATCYGTNGPVQNTLTVSVAGSGTVSGTGISCPSDCSETYSGATTVALTATPAGTNVFGGWSGACTGTGACNVSVNGYTSVGATFASAPPTVGNGTTIPVVIGTNVFNLTTAGTYKLTGTVIAADGGTNSLYVDIDSAATSDTTNMWDIIAPFSSAAQTRDVTWPGVNPKTFTLAAGIHTLYITAREPAQISQMKFSLATTGGDSENPSPVTGLTATAVSASQINLAWSASTDNVAVTGYKIYRNGSATALTTVTGTSYNDTGLTANTQYAYSVRATDAAGNLGTAAALSATTFPSASTKFIVGDSVKVSAATLNVRDVPNGSSVGTQPQNALGTITAPTGVYTTPTFAGGYWWWYVNYASGVDGWSAEDYLVKNVVVTTYTFGVTKSGTGTGTVSCVGLTSCPVQVNAGSTITLSAAADANSSFGGWTVPAGTPIVTGTCGSAVTCGVQVNGNTTVGASFNTVTSGTYTITATKTGNGTGKIASLLGSIDCGTLCTASITAGNTVTMNATPDVGSTLTALTLTPANSGTCLAMTPALGTCTVSTNTTITATFAAIVDTTAPSVPTGLVATALSSNSINITWTASTDNIVVAGYKVYRGGQLVGTVSSNSYQDAGLSPSTAYSYTVAAFDAAQNNSAQSAAVSATTQAAGNGQLIPADRAEIWNAGMDMVGGIPTNWPVSTTVAAGGNIQNAINAAPANTVVQLSAGSYSGSIRMKGNVILRGAGADKTTINGGIQVDGGGYPITDNQTIVRKNITSGYNKGSRQLNLDSASGFSVGDYIAIYQNNDSSSETSTGNIVNFNAGYACENGSSGNHCVMQFNKITGISGNTISIEEPVYYPAYAAANSPAVLKVQYGLAMAGIENLKVAGSGNGTGIYFEFARHSWVKGVEVYGFGGGNGQPQIMMDGTYGVEVRDSYLHGGPNSIHTSGSDYGFEIYRWNSNAKIENNIVTETRHGILFEGSGAGSVVLYNYVDDNWESNTSTYGDQGFLTGDIGTHTVHPNAILFEGNINSKMRFDYQLGTSGYNTVYRNWVRGTRSSYTPTWGQWLIDDMHGSNYYTYIGNVLGTTAFPTAPGSFYYMVNGNIQANGTQLSNTYGGGAAQESCQYPYAGSNEKPFVWRFGCRDNPGQYADTATNGKAFATAIIHGNYDYGTRSTHWDNSRTQTLPASLYYGTAAHPARPTWWPSAVAWPPIGPDVANLHNDIPAKKCYDSTSVKSTGKFSAAACY